MLCAGWIEQEIEQKKGKQKRERIWKDQINCGLRAADPDQKEEETCERGYGHLVDKKSVGLGLMSTLGEPPYQGRTMCVHRCII